MLPNLETEKKIQKNYKNKKNPDETNRQPKKCSPALEKFGENVAKILYWLYLIQKI